MKCGTCYNSCHHSVIVQSVRKVSSFTVAVMPYKFSKWSPLSQITSAQTSLLLFTMATTGDCNDFASWLYGGVFLCNLHKRFMNKNMKKNHYNPAITSSSPRLLKHKKVLQMLAWIKSACSVWWKKNAKHNWHFKRCIKWKFGPGFGKENIQYWNDSITSNWSR